jgi:hypothetical protein
MLRGQQSIGHSTQSYEMSDLDTSRTIVLPGAGSRLTIMLLAVDVNIGVVRLLSTNAVLFVLGPRAHLYGLLKHGNLNGGTGGATYSEER